MNMKNISIKILLPKLAAVARKLSRYSVVIFLVFIAAAYGFTLLRISSLTNTQPTTEEISAQYNPIKTSRIDPAVIKQLQSLRDNSVTIKTLFDEARDNPFQEQ
jgi:hypothetical protein